MSSTKEPSEVINALSKGDRQLLGEIMALEKRYLHLPELRPNTREDREIVSQIATLIDNELPK